ncbi:MAG: bleomycin resistance protein [Leptolyngbyaceae cyanobacterium bins.349]|nr:bleomycin resistance protein [Leptolyngbyaceae cyanobacterium bins.349]
MMNFHRFEHINQCCRNLDATRQFYQTLFPEWFVRAEGNDQGWRWMHFGNEQFYLALNQPPNTDTVSSSTGHLDHIGFVITDGEAMTTLLDTHHIPYEIYHSPETKCRIYVIDPDGTQVELVQYAADYALR